jgi:hypothetical protein
VENALLLLPLLVTFALVAGVVLKKLLAGDPTLKKKRQMFSGQ